MKKCITVLVLCFMTTSHLSAHQDADKCEALKGSWTWNGEINQWQCNNLDTTAKEVYAKYLSDKDITNVAQIEQIAIETNASSADVQPQSSDPLTLKKAVVYAAVPVVVAGAIVTAIVLSPVILVKKIFGN